MRAAGQRKVRARRHDPYLKLGFAERGEVFGNLVIAAALLDRLLHHAVVAHMEGSHCRMRQHADLLPLAPCQATAPGRTTQPPRPAGERPGSRRLANPDSGKVERFHSPILRRLQPP